MKRRTHTVAAAGLLAIAVAGSAYAQTRVPYNANPNAIRVRYGEFRPDGDSQYWRQREVDFFGGTSDWEDSIWGVDYHRMLTERWVFVAGFNSWEGEQRTSFRDFVDDRGGEIEHEASLQTDRLDLGIAYYFLRRNARVSPYAGFGGSFHEYDLEETGDFIDFDSGDVFFGSFSTSGDAFGWFWLVGVEVSVTDQVGIFGEARWNDASDELRGDFLDFGRLDLGGRDLSLGVSFRF